MRCGGHVRSRFFRQSGGGDGLPVRLGLEAWGWGVPRHEVPVRHVPSDPRDEWAGAGTGACVKSFTCGKHPCPGPSPCAWRSRPRSAPSTRRNSSGARLRTGSSGIWPTSTRPRRPGGRRRTRWPENLPQLEQYQGTLGLVGQDAGRRARPSLRLDKELSRLYVYASMLADQDTRDAPAPGHAAGDGAARRRRSAPQASFIEPEILRVPDRHGRAVPGGRTAAQAVPLLPRGHRPPRAAHAERPRGEAAGRRRCRSPASPSSIYSILVERRFPVSDGHAQRRQDRSRSTRRTSRAYRGVGQPRRSREGDVGLLQGARQLQPHVRHDDERRGAEGAVLRARRASIRRRSAMRSTVRTSRRRSTRASSTA